MSDCRLEVRGDGTDARPWYFGGLGKERSVEGDCAVDLLTCLLAVDVANLRDISDVVLLVYNVCLDQQRRWTDVFRSYSKRYITYLVWCSRAVYTKHVVESQKSHSLFEYMNTKHGMKARNGIQ